MTGRSTVSCSRAVRPLELSGVDKPMLEVDGIPLLHNVIAALNGAVDVVVVGPRRADTDGVRWAREDPPGGGPVAALAAGLAALPLESSDVAVLAADLPGLAASTVVRLRAALVDASNPAEPDGAVLVDASGRRQWLTGVWRAESLRAVLPADPAGASVRATLGGLHVVEVPAEGAEAADVDTPEDLARARRGRPSQRSHR